MRHAYTGNKVLSIGLCLRQASEITQARRPLACGFGVWPAKLPAHRPDWPVVIFTFIIKNHRIFNLKKYIEFALKYLLISYRPNI
jgi:hypothetical protein